MYMRDAFLSGCLVDCAEETKNPRKPMRRKAMVVALGLEGVLVLGLALWPLFAPVTLPPRVVLIDSIPYRSEMQSSRPAKPRQPNARTAAIVPELHFAASFEPGSARDYTVTTKFQCPGNRVLRLGFAEWSLRNPIWFRQQCAGHCSAPSLAFDASNSSERKHAAGSAHLQGDSQVS